MEATMKRVRGFCAVLLAGMASVGFAQAGSTSANESGAPSVQATKDPKDMSGPELTATVKRLDADLFSAYNNCDLEKFGSFFPEHLEFYHDQTGGGPMTREQLVSAIRQNICGKVHRDLVPRTRYKTHFCECIWRSILSKVDPEFIPG
jgi:hypothetical protein